MKIRTNKPKVKIYRVVTTRPPVDLLHNPMTVRELFAGYIKKDFGLTDEEYAKVVQLNDTITKVDNFSKVVTLFTYYTAWEVQSISSFVVGSTFYYTITFYKYI